MRNCRAAWRRSTATAPKTRSCSSKRTRTSSSAACSRQSRSRASPASAASQLEQAFHQIYDQRPAKLLFIKAAPNRKYLDVMEAMDAAHGAGVQVIGFTPSEQNK